METCIYHTWILWDTMIHQHEMFWSLFGGFPVTGGNRLSLAVFCVPKKPAMFLITSPGFWDNCIHTWYSKQPCVDELFPLDSGQIILFHQPRFPWNKGISLPQLPFGVSSCEVAIIWPDWMIPNVYMKFTVISPFPSIKKRCPFRVPNAYSLKYEKKNRPDTFHWNPGCLIRILINGLWNNPHIIIG